MGFSEERNGICMSNDLISRKAVIQVVDKHTTEDGKLDDDISVILEEIPTAYDVDAVCEEVLLWIEKKEKEAIAINENSLFPCDGFVPAILAGEAREIVEIVKNGGNKRWADEK